MRKILITTDFTLEATRNITMVLEFLNDSKSPVSVLLLNTYLLPRSEPALVIELNDELKKKSREGLAKTQESALRKNSNPMVTIETASHLGSLFNVVQNLLGREKYEIVSFCEAGADRVAELIRKESCPILITCA